MQSSKHHPGQDARDDSHKHVLSNAGKNHGGEGAHQHHALDADVDHPRSLTVDAAQSRKRDGRGAHQAADQHTSQVK